MTVIIINEDFHGFLGVAKDYNSAVAFLLDKHWIHDNAEVWDERLNYWVKLKDQLGEDWFDDMCRWTINEFNDYWDGSYYLEEVEVYE